MLKALLLVVIQLSFSIVSLAQFNHDWSFSVGSTGTQDYNEDNVQHVVDKDGNIYITALYPDHVDFDPTFATSNLYSNGGQQSFIAKYDGNGEYLWAKNIPQTPIAAIRHFSTDESGNLIVVGRFNAATDFDPGPFTEMLIPSGTNSEGFIAKYDPDGALLWVKHLGNTGTNILRAVVSDANNNIYVAGYLNGTVDLDPSSGLASFDGEYGTYLARYTPDGDYVWGGVIDRIFSGGLDPLTLLVNDGSLYFKGKAHSAFDADFGPGTDSIIGNSSYNHLMLKYSLDGEYQWGFTLGGGDDEEEGYIAVDDENIYVAGEFFGTILDFNLVDSTDYLASINGERNIFLASYDKNDLSFNWANRIVGAPYDARISGIGQEDNAITVVGSFRTEADFDPTSAQHVMHVVDPSTATYVAKYGKDVGDLFWVARSKIHHSVNSFTIDHLTQKAVLCGIFYDTTDVDFSTGNAYLYSGNGKDMYVASYTDITTGIEFMDEPGLGPKVYPNPATDVLNISSVGKGIYTLYNPIGELVMRQVITNSNTLGVSHIPSGLYFLHVTNDNSSFSHPIMISK